MRLLRFALFSVLACTFAPALATADTILGPLSMRGADLIIMENASRAGVPVQLTSQDPVIMRTMQESMSREHSGWSTVEGRRTTRNEFVVTGFTEAQSADHRLVESRGWKKLALCLTYFNGGDVNVTPNGAPCLSVNQKETAKQVLQFVEEAEREESDPALKGITKILKRQLRYHATGSVEP